MTVIPLVLTLLLAADVFPTYTAPNLSGEEVRIPAGLSGERNLLLVAFKREQQKNLDTWLKAMPAIVAKYPKLSYYEFPVIERPNKMVRFFIDNGMRGGISDKAQRARTVTLYIEKKPFKQSLGITSEDTTYTYLVDKSGKILWQESGDFTPAKGQALSDALGR